WAKVQTLQIQLTIPPGSICSILSEGSRGTANYWAKDIKNLIVIGYGATITNGSPASVQFHLGGKGLFDDGSHHVRVSSVQAGSTCVTLLTPNQTSLFALNSYALMAGFDLQGSWQAQYGFPPNLHFFEYVKIVSINPSTGDVCFESPLKNTYKSTWPIYNNFP